MMKLALLLPLMLAACATPQQIAAADDKACRSMGAQPGTDTYVRCRLVQQARHDQQSAQQAEALRRAGQALQSLDQQHTSTSCTTRQTLPGTWRTDC